MPAVPSAAGGAFLTDANAPQQSADGPNELFTFVFTDIEGSSQLWEMHGPAMRAALARHDALVRGTLERHGGHVFKTLGDSFCAAFRHAPDAVRAVLQAQRALYAAAAAANDNAPAAEQPPAREAEPPLPLHVRVALHTGPAERRDNDYFGAALNRTDRLVKIAHGGQTLLSDATAATLLQNEEADLPDGATLRDLGPHRLRDLSGAERVWQLCHPDLRRRRPDAPENGDAAAALTDEFPPLQGDSALTPPSNLARAAALTSFVGRAHECAQITDRLTDPATRLLTLTGIGGTGKTRLALQTAGGLLTSPAAWRCWPDGLFLVELASLRGGEDGTGAHTDAAATDNAVAAIARAVIGALRLVEEPGRAPLDTLLDHLRPKRLLLALDNCEHLIAAAARFVHLVLQTGSGLNVLATSREALGVGGEIVWRVPPLPVPPDPAQSALPPAAALLDAYPSVRLFADRAAAVSPASRSRTRTPRPLPPFAGNWTAFRSPSNLPPRGYRRCRPRRSSHA
jgi:class 3 adenylate cyclase